MNVLVLQPTRPSNPPALRARADELLTRMVGANPGMIFDVRQDDTALEIPAHPSKYMRHATVRNYMVDTYLRPQHSHVLWIDSDLIDYPANLPTLLHDEAKRTLTTPTIVAPMAVLDHYPERFYDIGGFVENGRRANMEQPWFRQTGDVIELDSVGCCYLTPAMLYHQGLRYSPPVTDYYVEHWSVMLAAKRKGWRICALTRVRATHAWLPDYGLEPS